MLDFDVVDVFTDRAFAGNQLAVVHGAADLGAAQCLAIAREFGFSETTFPGAVTHGDEYATRIFTPAREIPFAGHPTLGTAWVLRERGALRNDTVTQVCGAGRIGVRFQVDQVELSAPPRDLLGPLGEDLVASLLADLGLAVTDLSGTAYAAGCGLTFVHLPVTSDAVGRARTSARPLSDYAERFAAEGEAMDPLEGVNLVSVTGEPPSLQVHARVFVPGLSVPEDPATGSAAAGLGIALVASGVLPEGGRYTVTQGVELGRPSTLHGHVEVSVVAGHGWSAGGSDVSPKGEAAVCRVAGSVRPVAEGRIAVPEPAHISW